MPIDENGYPYKVVKPDYSKEYTVVVIPRPRCKHTRDGAAVVANYIVQEIKTNTRSPSAETIRFHNSYPQRLEEWKNLPSYQRAFISPPEPMYGTALAMWTERVFAGRPWDHKPLIKEKFKDVAVERIEYSEKQKREIPYKSFYHKYKTHDYFYDVWSNIHYGYVGLSVGFDEQTLLSGANIAQVIDSAFSDKEDPIDDDTAIKIGFALYKKFGVYADNLTYTDILDTLENEPDDKLPKSRKTHVCLEKQK